jgi:hypothetical protein
MDTTLDFPSVATCTTCRFKENKSNYWTAVMYFKHPNGSYIRVSDFEILTHDLPLTSRDRYHKFLTPELDPQMAG